MINVIIDYHKRKLFIIRVLPLDTLWNKFCYFIRTYRDLLKMIFEIDRIEIIDCPIWQYCILHIIMFIAPYIKACKRHDPKINECIMNSIEELRGKLAEGIPELDAPAIEPLKLNQIRLLRGPTGARLDINLTDIEVNYKF